MGFQCGIIGLPNVGKSTIFNALTSGNAEAANYPFCTIEPNTGVVALPDARLDVLGQIAKSAKLVPTSVEFVDIAGLVKGASVGEGLGNQFLGHIRSVDALVHVVRCFDDGNITHVHGEISPKNDIEVIETELMLADLSSVEKRFDKVARTAKTGDKQAKIELSCLELAKSTLAKGNPLRTLPDAQKKLAGYEFLTTKPLLYVANVAEKDVTMAATEDAPGYLGALVKEAKKQGCDVVVLSGMIEAEISQLLLAERQAFLAQLGLPMSGLDRLAVAGYKLLNLITFFTAGPKESRAWTCVRGSNAVDAAGKIHTDFAKGFIRAEVISYNDYVTYQGEAGVREKGLLRSEGKTYLMVDGDVVHFRFNV